MGVPDRKLIYGRFLVLPAIAGVFFAALTAAVQMSSKYGMYGPGIAAGIFAAALMILLLMGLMINHCFPAGSKQNFRVLFLVCEFLIFSVITVIGLELRIHLIQSYSQAVDYYGVYETADILRSSIRPEPGTPFFQLLCKDTEYYAYTAFESLLLSLFGYEETALIYGNLFLQVTGAVCAAGAARVFGGRFSGLTVYTLLMCLPQEAAFVVSLEGTPLYFSIFMTAVFLFAVIVDMEREDHLVLVHFLLYLIDGLLFGIASFLHPVTLAVLAALFLFLCFMRECREERPIISGMLRGLVLLAGACIPFFIMLRLKALDLKTSFTAVFYPYLQCYLPEGGGQFFSNYRTAWSVNPYADVPGGYTLIVENDMTILVMLCLCFVALVFAFVQKRKGAVPGCALFLGLFWLCGCGRVRFDNHLIFLVVLYLAGFLIQEFYLIFYENGEEKEADDLKVEPMPVVVPADASKKPLSVHPLPPQMTENEEEAETEALLPKKEIHYLENPLPGPKKHVPKSLEFDLEVPEDDDFDL